MATTRFRGRFSTLMVMAGLSLALVVSGGVRAASADAAPAFRPHIDVYLADGVTPVGTTGVHAGDILVVKGRGFDPNANTEGLPLPVPPGVPHGTFIAFGAFAPQWKPSQDAPESARATSRLGVQWAMSRDALARVPSAPFDMRRTIRQQWVPLAADGSFTAKLKASTPKDIPANARWGVYTYGAAGATNAAQELSVPVRYSTQPGPNTPKPAPADLAWAYTPGFYATVTERSQGTVYGTDGAGVDDSDRLTYTHAGGELRNGTGTLRFRGTIVAFTRFHLFEIALADPTITVRNGKGVLTMRTSTTNMNGTDALRRVTIADVDLTGIGDGKSVRGAKVTFRPGIRPEALALLSAGAASPLDLNLG